jgi:hypothetical protein
LQARFWLDILLPLCAAASKICQHAEAAIEKLERGEALRIGAPFGVSDCCPKDPAAPRPNSGSAEIHLLA